MAGRFVVLEGGDGAGKSTAINSLQSELMSRGCQALLLYPKRPELPSGYISKHMAQLSEILWEGNSTTPRHLLTDFHWLHLASAWYLIVDQYVVRPALESGHLVIADSWYDKLLARFRLKSTALADEAVRCFSLLTSPDLVLMLDIDPAIAASRKDVFGLAESGNLDGLVGQTRENFIKYQTAVRESFIAIADHRWSILDVSQMNSADVVVWLADQVSCPPSKVVAESLFDLC